MLSSPIFILIGLAILTGIITTSFFHWRQAVKATFLLLVLEGVLRKWVLPQASDLIYFLKDFVLLGAYIRFFFFLPKQQKIHLKSTFLDALIFVITGWCIVQALNPSLGSPLIGLFGLKAYLFYTPLIWILPTLFQSEEELQQFLRFHLLLVIPVGLLGVAQFFSPASSPLNVYAPGVIKETALFEGSTRVRVTGSFSYLNAYTGYLLPCFGLLLALLSIHQPKRWRFYLLAEVALLIANAVMTGSRNAVFACGLLFIGYVLLRTIAQPQVMFRFLKQLLVPTVVAIVLAFLLFRPAIDAFWFRASTSGDVPNRIAIGLSEPFKFMQYKDFDGFGTGATHQGSDALRLRLRLPQGETIPVYYEQEMGRIALELGPLGFGLWYGMRFGIMLALLRNFWKLKRPLLRYLSLVAFLTQFVWIAHQLVFHNTFALYYWFFAGFALLLPHLERVEMLKQKSPQLFFINPDVQPTYLPHSPSR